MKSCIRGCASPYSFVAPRWWLDVDEADPNYPWHTTFPDPRGIFLGLRLVLVEAR